MHESDFPAFSELIAKLAAYYPRGRNDDPSSRAEAWFKPMMRFDLETIEQAIHRMPEVSPEWHPSCGTVITECRKVSGVSRTKKEKNEKEKHELDDEALYNRYLDSMPEKQEWLDEWIDKAPNACMRLSRQWMAAAKKDGRRADHAVPRDEQQRRIRALVEAMGE